MAARTTSTELSVNSRERIGEEISNVRDECIGARFNKESTINYPEECYQ